MIHAASPVIDAHLHVWDLARADYPWLGPQHSPINRSIDFDEVRPQLDDAGISGVVLVQSSDNKQDTGGMVRTAHLHPEVLGIVGWVPLERPQLAEELLSQLDPTVVGIRNLIHDRDDPDWVIHGDFDAGLTHLEALDLPFDFVTSGPAALAHIPGIIDRHPKLRVIIDHLGKPPVNGDRAAAAHWRELLERAAESTHVSAKISGLYSSVGSEASWTLAAIQPFVDDALEMFGASRLMYGGDWPMSVLAGGYSRVAAAIEAALNGTSADDRDAIFGRTAVEVYGLSTTSS